MSDDLYRALGVARTATTDQLREALERIRTSHSPTSAEYLAATQAYAVLGDPRLRAAYDAGRVVGTGVGNYFEAGRAPESPGLAARWAARQAVSIPAVRQRADLRVRWPFVFLAGNVSGFFVTVIALRLALGHPLN